MSYPTLDTNGGAAEALATGARLIVVGDSYCMDGLPYRLPYALVRSVPLPPVNAHYTAGGNTAARTAQWQTGQWLTGETDGVNVEIINHTNNYQINIDEGYWGIPGLGLTVKFDPTLAMGPQGRHLTVNLNDAGETLDLTNSATGFTLVNGVDCKLRPIFYTHTRATQNDRRIAVYDGNTDRGAFYMNTDVRGFVSEGDAYNSTRALALEGSPNAFSSDIRWNTQPFINQTVLFFDDSQTTGYIPNTDRCMNWLGGLIYEVDGAGDYVGNGTYLQAIADSGWATTGHASPSKSSGVTPKQYDLEDLTRFIDLTTLDPKQENVVVVCMDAIEAGTEAATTAFMVKYEAAFSACNLKRPNFVFVHPWGTGYAPATTDAYGQAIYDAQASKENAEFISIQRLNGDEVFDGSASGRAWLVANGYTAIDTALSGDLLDAGEVHPRDPQSVEFFASFLSDPLTHWSRGYLGRRRRRGVKRSSRLTRL